MEAYTCHWDAQNREISGLWLFAQRVMEDLSTAISADLRNVSTGALDEPDPAQTRPPSLPVRPSEILLQGEPPAEPVPGPVTELGPKPPMIENLQFTVYRPKAVKPEEWYPLLAFAHLGDRPEGSDPNDPDPIEEVGRQAEALLGQRVRDFKSSTNDSRLAVPPESELTFVPVMKGVTFNPPRRSFLFVESVQREEFRLRARREVEGQTARRTLSVYLGSIILADIPLSVSVQSSAPGVETAGSRQKSSARPYRKILASYSHRDLPVVEELKRYARTLGDRYIRDWIDLRAGEIWDNRLYELIEEADVFQLFWSTNSMQSQFVEHEWRHALSLRRSNFVRPTYWEDPFPRDPQRNLPPEELAQLHFHCLEPALAVLARPDSVTGSDRAADEVSLGEMPSARVTGASDSGINLQEPADSGISREQGSDSREEIEFELSLDAESIPKPAKAAPNVDSSSEFELNLEDSARLAPLEEEAAPAAAEEEKDIFETDFEVPALEDESGSQAVALDESDTDLESSDFDLALGDEDMATEDESGSQIVALEDEEEVDEGAATVARPRRGGAGVAEGEEVEELLGEDEGQLEAEEEPEVAGRRAPERRLSETAENLIAMGVGLLVLVIFLILLGLLKRD
jgi:hypothetical protein